MALLSRCITLSTTASEPSRRPRSPPPAPTFQRVGLDLLPARCPEIAKIGDSLRPLIPANPTPAPPAAPESHPTLTKIALPAQPSRFGPPPAPLLPAREPVHPPASVSPAHLSLAADPLAISSLPTRALHTCSRSVSVTLLPSLHNPVLADTARARHPTLQATPPPGDAPAHSTEIPYLPSVPQGIPYLMLLSRSNLLQSCLQHGRRNVWPSAAPVRRPLQHLLLLQPGLALVQ